jgi:glucokinase
MTSVDSERLLLGLDIGGTKTVVVLARATGEILAESRLEDWATGAWESDIETLVNHSQVLMRGSGLDLSALHAVGISAPGPLNIDTGVVLEAPNIRGWVNVPIVQKLWEAFGVQVLLENDANAAALAEWRFGAGQGARDLIYLTMSTGVGAGLILDSRLYRGARFQAGEIGHVPIVLSGRECSCGLKGCLEAYTGGAALAEIIREDIEGGEQTSILELAGGDLKKISAKLWTDAIRDSDAYALRLRERFLDHLAQGVVLLLASLDPDTVVFGTIIAKNPDLFLEELEERVHASSWAVHHDVRLLPARLGDRLPAYAALCVASLEPGDLAPPSLPPAP